MSTERFPATAERALGHNTGIRGASGFKGRSS